MRVYFLVFLRRSSLTGRWIEVVVLEEKVFSEVFDPGSMSPEIYDFFSGVTVKLITMSPSRNVIKVYIKCGSLIKKAKIYELEDELAKKAFADTHMNVKVVEEYELPENYTTKYILDNYYESVLLEISRYDRFIYTLLRKQKPVLSENELKIALPDTFLSHEKEKRVKEIFDKVFNDRLHQDLEIKVFYEKAEKELLVKEKESRIRGEIEAISKRVLSQNNEEKKEEDKKDSSVEEAFMTLDDAEFKDIPVIEENKLEKKKEKTEKTEEKKTDKREKADKKPYKANYEKGKSSSSKGGRMKSLTMSDDPSIVFGRDFDGEVMAIKDITDEIGEVVFHGQILNIEDRDIKTGTKIIKYTISDYTDSVRIKLFIVPEFADQMLGALKKGDFIQLKGLAKYDDYDKEVEVGNVVGIRKIKDFREERQDFNELKRVELHAHTKMSDMAGCIDVKALVSRAVKFGHPAVAVTDYGNVQSFPDAAHQKAETGADIKILYGLDAYVVDDTKLPVTAERGQTLRDRFVVFDIETTGFVPTKNKIIEIGAVKVEDGKIKDVFSEFVNPGEPIPFEITDLTSIRDADVAEAGSIEEVLPRFLDFCNDSVLVAHNARFDTSFIRYNAVKLGLEYDFTHTDTIDIARIVLPFQKNMQLHKLAEALGVKLMHHHRAVDDARMTAGIFVKQIELLEERKIYTLADLNRSVSLSDAQIAGMHPYNALIFAKNETGRRNLYRLVSESHLRFFGRKPNLPKSEIEKYRDGLIIGSASEEGELMQDILNERGDAAIVRDASWYDFLEIVPADNLRHFINDDKMPTINSIQDIRDINKRILALGKELGKPVCACGDVHYLDPDDVLYEKILKAREIKKRFRKKSKDGSRDIWKDEEKSIKEKEEEDKLLAKKKPAKEEFDSILENISKQMYFMTTSEMLDEFQYLGADDAFETVITAPNKIADMCDVISPVRPDKCPPVIEDSDKTLRRICYDKAHELYGDELPPVVLERLERELNSIIGNGYAVMYIIAQKLVWKSVEDGYLVGSRGSVGSSFVATMAGITEVNPLVPHYRCGKCKYSDFDSPELKEYAGRAGVDMPDKVCPVCGEMLIKDGFDIPFETFLGFKGDKEPDIDLNFSSEYQSKAHKYTEVIFGYGQTYKAGTVGTLADKNSFAITREYFDLTENKKRQAEIERLSTGIVGVRNTTGQHPGGIVVLPEGEDINSFTPIQHPADDMESNIITTHFDYHKIDQNLLKLDILGHDDPTMIRMLQDLTNVDPLDIPLDDPGVMSLFKNTEALGITPEDIGGTKLGTLGIPEFGTDFAMGMLLEAKPQAFSDLVRIAGLSHGTDVWLGNAEELIKSGTATISTCICTRDDIMTYLINMGVDPAESFSIMENVRKGKVAGGKVKQWPEWKADMSAHGVPDWYIGSCEKIKYMFPKAHAAAYVMMGWRVAWYKINYPLAYYAAFFSIRSKGFSYEMMCMGKEKLELYMEDIRNKEASNKEENNLHDMRLVQEMYARGFDFMPIDIYRAKAKNFQIIDGKIMPSFISIEGLGETNAVLMEEEARKAPFSSRQNLKDRTKTPSKIIDLMVNLHMLDGLPESDQISLFDIL